ncbi:MAG: ribosome biogenesis GTP-binding protein YihA/YsxC [Desulfatibacillaceae bacterium]|nr:ribosome biogenesis GTP-binding protein YihA/YsxC [Desulfatibacillaceae bacterium]
MIIKSAEFVTSAGRPGEYPPASLPEIAFAGRSNAGKSSLANTLLKRKSLFKTSSKPGLTRRINFFIINEALYFVDLPGYGYAKVSKTERAKWGPMIETYLSNRATLAAVVLVLDVRRLPGVWETELLAWLAFHGKRCIVAATKADKLSANKAAAGRASIARALSLPVDEVTLFSAKTGLGREALWNEITLSTELDIHD